MKAEWQLSASVTNILKTGAGTRVPTLLEDLYIADQANSKVFGVKSWDQPAEPITVPTSMPSSKCNSEPTSMPSAVPTSTPSAVPTSVPSAVPTSTCNPEPTSMPSVVPTVDCNFETTSTPSAVPTYAPTCVALLPSTDEPSKTKNPHSEREDKN